MGDYNEYLKMVDGKRSPEIQALKTAFLNLSVSVLEEATDRDLSDMFHPVVRILKEIQLRYFVKVDTTKAPGQWWNDQLKNSHNRDYHEPKFGWPIGGKDDQDH